MHLAQVAAVVAQVVAQVAAVVAQVAAVAAVVHLVLLAVVEATVMLQKTQAHRHQQGLVVAAAVEAVQRTAVGGTTLPTMMAEADKMLYTNLLMHGSLKLEVQLCNDITPSFELEAWQALPTESANTKLFASKCTVYRFEL